MKDLLKLRLAELEESVAELNKMYSEADLTIREHCDSLRQQVNMAREAAIEKIDKASDTSMNKIHANERERQ